MDERTVFSPALSTPEPPPAGRAYRFPPNLQPAISMKTPNFHTQVTTPTLRHTCEPRHHPRPPPSSPRPRHPRESGDPDPRLPYPPTSNCNKNTPFSRTGGHSPTTLILANHSLIPANPSVIPAKAGTQTPVSMAKQQSLPRKQTNFKRTHTLQQAIGNSHERPTLNLSGSGNTANPRQQRSIPDTSSVACNPSKAE